jgi:REP element-mobilizing transposase RayT
MRRGPLKHDRRSVRLEGYDYSQDGAYFVTICTRDRALLFENEEVRAIVEQCWLGIPDHFPTVQLDEWVIMPNHLHGIVVIVDCRGTACRAPTVEFGNPTPGSLSTIIRSFKSAVSKRINILRDTPGASVWQRNYYEHVIRTEDELNRARQYILDNPLQWVMDENNPSQLLGKSYGVTGFDR